MTKVYERLNTKMDVPKDILEFHKLYKNAGFKLFVVGGAVRDFLLGKVPHDFDLVTNALPEESLEILKDYRTDVHGAKFGVVRVYTEDEPMGYEIAPYRKDISRGRDTKGNDQKVELGKHLTVKDDVKRRDLTVNALFYDLDNNQIVDVVGGVRDLENNVIRAVGVPQKRFNEDRLRILRTIRFAAVMGGEIDKETSEAIKRDNRLFGISPEDDVSRERIFLEFLKVKEKARENNDPAIVTRFIDLLIDYDILKQIFPVLVATKSIRSTSYLSVGLAQTLRNNIPDETFRQTLLDAKIHGKYVDIIIFLLKILRHGVNPSNVYDLYREMKSKEVRPDILQEWIKVMSISDPMVIAFLHYSPSTSGQDVMKDGFKRHEIGEEIKRREGEKFKKLVDTMNERNILKFNQFLNESVNNMDELEKLRKENPEFTFNLKKIPNYENKYHCNVYKEDKYIGGVRGSVRYEDGIDFFKNLVRNHNEENRL